MPLKKGKSKKAFESNVKELVETYKRTGSIGGSSPRSEEQARRQAVAIAYEQKRRKRK